ncbi:unnamed protein product [Brachionus calyciflorus]|uniref:Uncharacterized protein n=1 Tax=Brachionus calyciflorus TaxID=104777 RepID=A0A814BIX6_9BILA|nr:unnamed protein product [Brachionus calyciflorus]
MSSDQDLNKYYENFESFSKYNVILSLTGFFSLIESVLQITFCLYSNNFIYFLACVAHGPLFLIASILFLISNCFKSMNAKYNLATWSTRFLTIGLIPLVNTIALHSLYIYECVKTDNQTSFNFEDNSEINLCNYFYFDVAILILSFTSACLNLFFCIPFNLE